jgi:hypothetical protein
LPAATGGRRPKRRPNEKGNSAQQQGRTKEATPGKRLEFERQVAQAIRDCPSMTQLEIAGRFGISRQEIAAIATRHGAKRKRGAGSPASTQWRKCLVE